MLTRVQTSTLIDPICEILGIDNDDTPPELATMIELFNESNDDQRKVTLDFIRSVHAMKKAQTKDTRCQYLVLISAVQ